jgi:hypothetical protein
LLAKAHVRESAASTRSNGILLSCAPGGATMPASSGSTTTPAAPTDTSTA